MGRLTIPYAICDVFTKAPLEGNQLGVFPDAGGLSGEQMQRLARELNFSESTFVLPPEGDGDARIRIFTRAQEVPFAGHPTLGTAWVLAESRGTDRLTLETRSGPIPLRFERTGGRLRFGWMAQPIPTMQPFDRTEQVLAGIRVERSQLPVELYDNGIAHVYVVLGSEDEVASVQPDPSLLLPLGDLVGINCVAGQGASWKTRMFFSSLGLVEDAATGSAAGPLAVHLARHGRIEWGREIEIRQGAEIGRPSTLFARAEGSGDRVESVEVGGSAVVVARGTFEL